QILFFFSPPSPDPQFSSLSLHDALPIYDILRPFVRQHPRVGPFGACSHCGADDWQKRGKRYLSSLRKEQQLLWCKNCRSWEKREDRKSTRLNSSHGSISYAVFCLKKKKQ